MDELSDALALATDEELQQLTQILFCRRFNPLDYLQTPEPIDVQSQDRQSWLQTLEARFRFLAADGITVLQGRTQEVTYRQVLIQVCRYLKISYAQEMSTLDLESEIFLNLLGRAWKRLPQSEKKSLTLRIQRSLANMTVPQPLPAHIQHNPVEIVLKGSSIFAVNSVLKPFLLKQIAYQFALHFASYQTAKTTLLRGGTAAIAKFQNRVLMQTARQGMAVNTARYAAVRGFFTVLGPFLWGWFFAELGWKVIATNYSRIIPIIFTLAQIRLTRMDCLDLL